MADMIEYLSELSWSDLTQTLTNYYVTGDGFDKPNSKRKTPK